MTDISTELAQQLIKDQFPKWAASRSVPLRKAATTTEPSIWETK